MNKIATKIMGWLIVVACCLMPLTLQATDETVGGNLTVNGTSDLWGNDLYFGTHTGSPNTSGVTLDFADGTTTTLSFNATSSSNVWQWQQNAGTTLQLQMTLDNNNTLTLFDQSTPPAAGITLNPIGTSSIASSVTLSGTDNEMPNQTLVGSNSVLTETMADSRYYSASWNLELPTQNSSDSGSVATEGWADGRYITFDNLDSELESNGFISWGEAATGYVLVYGSWTGGTSHDALGESTATGADSMAMGYSIASGSYSTAMGYSTASGDYTASAGFSMASGAYSAAMGNTTVAGAFGSLSMGQFNIGGFASGGDTAWISTDPLLELGNGTDASHPSDALVVYKNGNATFQGLGERCAVRGHTDVLRILRLEHYEYQTEHE